jgi:hypothetical protein
MFYLFYIWSVTQMDCGWIVGTKQLGKTIESNNTWQVFGFKFFKVYQNLVISLFLYFLPNFFYHVKTHLWMIMMESKIVMV